MTEEEPRTTEEGPGMAQEKRGTTEKGSVMTGRAEDDGRGEAMTAHPGRAMTMPVGTSGVRERHA